MMDWISKVFISIFIAIDRVVYFAIEKVYELFMLISEAGLFSQATIQTFANRIYVFLGLIMIFVVSVSLVKYILDPKSFNDGKVGAPALLKNFAFVLIGIIAIPYVFEAAYGLQRIILKDNIIGNLILGVRFTGQEKDDEDASFYATYGGKMIAYSMFSAFATFNPEVASHTCINEPVKADGKYNREACGQVGDVPYSGGLDENGNEIKDVATYMEFIYRNKDFRTLANKELLTLVYESTAGDYPLFDYSFILSTFGGIFIIYILLGFCLDVAVRSVKLGFLQLIAPIPLMMKIIPGSGQKRFDSWMKQCVSTYFDVFTRLAAIYFSIFIIASITTDGIQNVAGTENFVRTVLVKAAIIIGALIFAKDLPKIIKDVIGGSGEGFTLNPLKKIGSSPYAAAAIGGGLGMALGTGSNFLNAGKKIAGNINKDYIGRTKNGQSSFGAFMGATGKGIFSKDGLKGVGSTFAGGFSGANRGISAGMSGKGKDGLWKLGANAAADSSAARVKRDAGYGFKETFSKEASRIMGQKNTYGQFGKASVDVARMENEVNDAAKAENRAAESLADLQNQYFSQYEGQFAGDKGFSQFHPTYGDGTVSGAAGEGDLKQIDKAGFTSMFERIQEVDGTYGSYTNRAQAMYDEYMGTLQGEYNSAASKNTEIENEYRTMLSDFEANKETMTDSVRAQISNEILTKEKALEESRSILESSSGKIAKMRNIRQQESIRNEENTRSVHAKKRYEKTKKDNNIT